MNWTFAMTFAVLWALGMKTANGLGASVHVLLLISGIFALVAIGQRRRLVWQERAVLAPAAARAWSGPRFGRNGRDE